MHEQIEQLRARIDEVARGADGRRVFTAAIRKEATKLAKQWKAKGRHLSALADALDLHKTTLRAWLGESKPKSKSTKRAVRPVEVSEQQSHPRAPFIATSTSRIIATLPSGVRLEGLSLDDVLRLEGALR